MHCVAEMTPAAILLHLETGTPPQKRLTMFFDAVHFSLFKMYPVHPVYVSFLNIFEETYLFPGKHVML